jgi:hypothetical protein
MKPDVPGVLALLWKIAIRPPKSLLGTLYYAIRRLFTPALLSDAQGCIRQQSVYGRYPDFQPKAVNPNTVHSKLKAAPRVH